MIIVITVKRFNFSQLTNSHCWLFILCFLMLFLKFVYQNLYPPFLVNWPIFFQFHGIWFSHVSYCFCCFVSLTHTHTHTHTQTVHIFWPKMNDNQFVTLYLKYHIDKANQWVHFCVQLDTHVSTSCLHEQTSLLGLTLQQNPKKSLSWNFFCMSHLTCY